MKQFSMAILASVVLLIGRPSDVFAQYTCNSCVPCEDGIQTHMGVSPWPILFLNQPTCMVYEGGCDDLIECPPSDEDAQEQFVAAVDVDDRASMGTQIRKSPDLFEVVPDRNIVLIKSCTGVVGIKTITDDQLHYLLTQQ